jgi:alkaline phosphatase
MSPDGKNKYLSILEASKNKGMATGLVATSTITHATPASFASHVGSRKGEDDIAIQLLENKVNVLFGGGKQFFIPQSAQGSKRKDDRDLLAEAKAAGYAFVETNDDLKSAQEPFLLGLFQLDALKTDPPEPTLAELTDKAIETLSKNKKGFFLMVEGSQIDWACHANNFDDTIKQTILFDEAVGKVIDFALRDKQTLVIVTADHETGGLSIKGGKLDGKNLVVGWGTTGHSAVPVPLYALGPGAKEFAGVYDNTEIPKKMAKLLKIKSFPQSLE